MGTHGAPSLLKNLDSSSRSGGALHWRRRTRMGSSIHPCSRIWRRDASGLREVDDWLLFATTVESRHVTTRDNDSPKSTPLCNCHLALTPRSITCCSSRRRREFATSLRASAWAPIPAQEPGGWMYWMCWMGRRQRGLEEYVPLRYSSPSSVYSFQLAPHTSLLKNLDGGPLLSRATASPG